MIERLNLARRQDEDEYAYIYRVCSQKDVIGTWGDVGKILNDQLGYEYTESKYRKQYQSFQTMFESNQALSQPDTYLKEIEEKTREMHRERMKLQTEKLEYNRWLREHARDELIVDKITDAIRELPPIDVPATYRYGVEDSAIGGDNKTGILCIADPHYGTEFCIKGLNGEVINAYSPEIFEERMEELLIATFNKVVKNGLQKIKVFSLGDELDGILRVSQLSKLRYGVVESTIRYSEYLCHWLTRLTEFVDVEFQMVEGNHTELRQLGQPKGTFTEDNMSRIIKQFIKVRMENNPHFVMIENESGLIFDTIYGLNALGIHGEVKNMDAALKNFSVMYNTQIDILIGAHKHHHSAESVGIGKDVISVPSIIGVDAFSMRIGKTSDAGAAFVIVEDGFGVTEQHIIKFTV